MAKLKAPDPEYVKLKGAGFEAYDLYCPGCDYHHRVVVSYGQGDPKTQPKWSFNGSMDSPTFNPSLLCREYDGDTVVHVCHSFITDGHFNFLNDCTHALAGQRVKMLDV